MCILNQGREFVNEVNQRLFDKVGIEHRISSAYHPQTNGLDERMNQTVMAKRNIRNIARVGGQKTAATLLNP